MTSVITLDEHRVKPEEDALEEDVLDMIKSQIKVQQKIGELFCSFKPGDMIKVKDTPEGVSMKKNHTEQSPGEKTMTTDAIIKHHRLSEDEAQLYKEYEKENVIDKNEMRIIKLEAEVGLLKNMVAELKVNQIMEKNK